MDVNVTLHTPHTHGMPLTKNQTYQRRVEQEVAGEEVQLVPRRRRAAVPVQRLRLGLGGARRRGPQLLFVNID